jgi:hypothetical protein
VRGTSGERAQCAVRAAASIFSAWKWAISGLDQGIEVPFHQRRELMDGEADAVVRHPTTSQSPLLRQPVGYIANNFFLSQHSLHGGETFLPKFSL